MRIKLALILVAALALAVPGAALAHQGDRDHGAIKHELRDDAKKHVRHAIDHRIDRWWRAHYDHKRHQTFELGAEELLLTGNGKLGSRTVQQPEGTSSSFRAWRGILKIWALSDDVVVECKGRGYKRSWKQKDGVEVTKCKGIGSAIVTGGNYMVYFKTQLGQAKFPAGSMGTVHTWGFWFAGPEMPEDPEDETLGDQPTDVKPADDQTAGEGSTETDSSSDGAA